MSDIENKENKSNFTSNSFHEGHKLVFENVYGELDFYKRKCDVLERDLFKSQTQVKKLEISMKKVAEINALNGKVSKEKLILKYIYIECE